MTDHLYYTGSIGPSWYNDEQPIIDPVSGQLTGFLFEAFQTTGQMSAFQPPVDKQNVLRVDDFLGVGGVFADYAFNLTVTGFSDVTVAACRAHRSAKLVGLYIPPIAGTSNSALFELTGLPASIVPKRTAVLVTFGQNSGAWGAITVLMTAGSNKIRLFAGVGSPFVASGLKSVVGCTVPYILF